MVILTTIPTRSDESSADVSTMIPTMSAGLETVLLPAAGPLWARLLIDITKINSNIWRQQQY